jgi:hypothetical protein
MKMRRSRSHGFAGVILVMLAVPSPIEGQIEDSVTIVAGPRYAAGTIKSRVLGAGYRDLWTTPIRVPVLRPDTFVGGLVLLQRGESPRTRSLRFRDGAGREYVFRSIDKEQGSAVPRDLRGTLGAAIVQDLVAAKNPAAALMAAPLMEAAGILHAPPRIVVMANDPLLGEHREEFAGMLGTIERRPNESGDGSPKGPGRTAGGIEASDLDAFSRIIGEERLGERLRESPDDRVDSRAYLAARLVDLLIGDWDRHPDQWRWAQVDQGNTRSWLPIPRDRDNAFFDVGGFAAVLLPAFRSGMVRFEDRYGDLYDLLHNAQLLDRHVLAELPLEVWDSVAVELGSRITDVVIAEAVSRMPIEWAELRGESLAATLRSRRDALPQAAREFYRLLSTEIEIHGTDANDRADLEHLSNGSLRVRLSRADGNGEPYFDRTFVPSETHEVRVHLHGGADRATVSGVRGASIGVRIIGGAGEDVLVDRSSPARPTVTFYGDESDRILGGRGTRIDRRPHEHRSTESVLEGNAPPPRDWGSRWSSFVPKVASASELGPMVGGGPEWTRYGFRAVPYRVRAGGALLYAPLHRRIGAEAHVTVVPTGGGGETRISARATGLSASRFHGFGNDSNLLADRGLTRVWATAYGVDLSSVREIGRDVSVTVATSAEYTLPEARAGSPAALEGAPGSRSFGVAAAGLEVAFDRRDPSVYPRRGLRLRSRITGSPIVWGDIASPFATSAVEAAVYLPVAGPLEPTLALRAGGHRTFGVAPLQLASAIGGASTLRGYDSRRFVGDAALNGGAELRTALGPVNLLVIRPELGFIGFSDVGRVFMAAERSRRWHHSFGGGLWFGFLERSRAVHVLYARGERHSLHLGTGLTF